MNGWVKYVGLSVYMMHFIEFNAEGKIRIGSCSEQSIDTRSRYVLHVNTAIKKAILSVTSTFNISALKAAWYTWLPIDSRSEDGSFVSEKVKIFNFRRLPHTEIQDLKIAVEDNRNINYLNPDF